MSFASKKPYPEANRKICRNSSHMMERVCKTELGQGVLSRPGQEMQAQRAITGYLILAILGFCPYHSGE